jgi:hypothetical protein
MRKYCQQIAASFIAVVAIYPLDSAACSIEHNPTQISMTDSDGKPFTDQDIANFQQAAQEYADAIQALSDELKKQPPGSLPNNKNAADKIYDAAKDKIQDKAIDAAETDLLVILRQLPWVNSVAILLENATSIIISYVPRVVGGVAPLLFTDGGLTPETTPQYADAKARLIKAEIALNMTRIQQSISQPSGPSPLTAPSAGAQISSKLH